MPSPALSIGYTEINKIIRLPSSQSCLPGMRTDIKQEINDKLVEHYGGEEHGRTQHSHLAGGSASKGAQLDLVSLLSVEHRYVSQCKTGRSGVCL